MCGPKTEEIEYDPSLELKYGIKLVELSNLMQMKSIEATEKVNSDYGGVAGMTQKLNSNLVNGLSSDERDLKERQVTFGRNEIPPRPPKLFITLVLEALQDTILIILLVCAIVSIGLSFYHPPDEDTLETQKKTTEANLEWIEGVAIFAAVFVVVFVTAFNDWRKERQFRGLQDRIEKDNLASVIRNGDVIQINIKDLVVGDICCIKYGDLIPADGLVIQSSDLKIDESSLTGESDLIKKNDTNNAIVLSGTHVMEGTGKFVVTAVGLNSQNGIIFALLGATKVEKKKPKPKASNVHDANKQTEAQPLPEATEKKHRSVLQLKLTKLAIQIGYAGMLSALFTFLILVLRLVIDEFLVKKNGWSNKYISYFLSYLIQGVTVIVVAVPEGLPLAVTLSLAYAVRKMTIDNNLVRHLDACETMGNATTICSDKTGTLTTNRMTVVQCYISDVLHKTVPNKDQVQNAVKELIFEAISVNSNYTSRLEPSTQPGEMPKQLGNKTECGLLGFVLQLGGNYDQVRTQFPTEEFVKVYTFNSARKMMSTIVKKKDGSGYRLFTKGASEMVLSKCSFITNAQGKPEPLNKDKINDIIKNVVEVMACDGLRTISVAYRDFPLSETCSWDDEAYVINELTCVCLVGIEDPVRDEVPDAIRKCQSSGVVVRMVTGDNVNTATSIAIKCGIITPGDNFLVLESKDFNKRIRDSNNEVQQKLLDEVWPKLRVLARSSPQDKYILVNGIVESKLSANREVVAVTGDGTNDGPALKRADVGFAMGIQGTDVAKEASDIILTDDNFSSIVKALMWGRNVYDSISKFLQFQLCANFVAAVLSIVCAATIRSVPLKAVQMLWVNLVMDTLGSLSLATEPPSESLLKRKPYGRNKPMLSPSLLKNIIGHGILQLAIIFGLVWGVEDWMLIDSVVKYNDINKLRDPSQHFTVIFNAFVLMTLFNEINARKINGEHNVFQGIHKNPYFYVIWIGCFAGQIIIVNFGDVAFSVVPLDIDHWIWCLAFGFATLIWGQILTAIPVSFFKKIFCCFKRRGVARVDNSSFSNHDDATAKNGNNTKRPDASKNATSDAEPYFDSKVLWLRGMSRIHSQLNVINAFQYRLEEIKNRRSSFENILSLKDVK